MNDDLIARLRELAAMARFLPISDDLDAAADALEAAQRKLAWDDDALEALVEQAHTLRAERDAEAALADQLAGCVDHGDGCNFDGKRWSAPMACTCGARAALAAHRERRTTHTKDGER